VGAAAGVQVDLTPLGARRILGLPMDELTNRVVALEDVLGRGARDLVGRLREARAWPERFALLDAALLRRVDGGPEPAPEVAWSYRRLAAAEGRLAVGPLADEVGWSRRHLAARWRRDVGMGPKAMARILRFERALRLLREGRGLADVAYDCGYADQPHLNREFRALAGSTPREVTFVQDPAVPAG
jgi:AraC-like DNA-binding protein